MAEQNKRHALRPPGGGHGPMMGVDKAKDFKGTIGKLFRYIGRYKAAVVSLQWEALYLMWCVLRFLERLPQDFLRG